MCIPRLLIRGNNLGLIKCNIYIFEMFFVTKITNIKIICYYKYGNLRCLKSAYLFIE